MYIWYILYCISIQHARELKFMTSVFFLYWPMSSWPTHLCIVLQGMTGRGRMPYDQSHRLTMSSPECQLWNGRQEMLPKPKGKRWTRVVKSERQRPRGRPSHWWDKDIQNIVNWFFRNFSFSSNLINSDKV